MLYKRGEIAKVGTGRNWKNFAICFAIEKHKEAEGWNWEYKVDEVGSSDAPVSHPTPCRVTHKVKFRFSFKNIVNHLAGFGCSKGGYDAIH